MKGALIIINHMAGLDGSGWAPGRRPWGYGSGSRPLPNPPSQTLTSKPALSHPVTPMLKLETASTSITSLEQYFRLLRRLQWKAQLLLYSHHLALQASPGERGSAEETSDDPALTQFHLDFFELYTLLERILVHILAIFDISVPRADPLSNGHAPAKATEKPIVGARHYLHQGHSFHQNVLLALDQPGPLHNVLGKGEVREWLGFAKDLRNRWKDAGEVDASSRVKGSWQHMLGAAPDAEVQHQAAEEEDDPYARELPDADLMSRMLGSVIEPMETVKPLIEEKMRQRTHKATDSQTKGEANGTVDKVVIDDQFMDLDNDDDVPFEVLEDEMEIG